VASLSQGRTAAAQCGLFTYKSVPVIFEPPCIILREWQDALNLERRTVPFYIRIQCVPRSKHFPPQLWKPIC